MPGLPTYLPNLRIYLRSAIDGNQTAAMGLFQVIVEPLG